MYYIIEKQHDRVYTPSMANLEYKTTDEAIKKMVALNNLLGKDQKEYTTYFIAEKLYPKDQ
jgi:hypothetical protein|tara:strand:- start:139 stop:321 length:183 start_codon:yes stop_codon:yes gene_type:complete